MIDEIFFVDTAYTLFWAQVNMHGSTVALSYRWWTVSEGDEKGDFFLSGRAAGAVRPVRYPFRSSSAPPVSPRASALAPRRLPRATRYDCTVARSGRASGGASGGSASRAVFRSVSYSFRALRGRTARNSTPTRSSPALARSRFARPAARGAGWGPRPRDRAGTVFILNRILIGSSVPSVRYLASPPPVPGSP